MSDQLLKLPATVTYKSGKAIASAMPLLVHLCCLRLCWGPCT